MTDWGDAFGLDRLFRFYVGGLILRVDRNAQGGFAGKLDSVIREDEVVREEFLAPKKKGPNFLVRLSRKVMGVEARETLREKLAHAGLSERYTPEEFYALKIACAAISFSVLSLLAIGSGARAVFAGLCFGALGYMLPDVWLNDKGQRRRAEIEKAMLSFIDMLAVACEAGLSVPQAVEKIASYQSSLLGSEFVRAFKEAELGRPRRDALKDMAERNGVPELSELVSAIVQADEHGTPVAKVLRGAAGELRLKRRNKALEVAQKSSVKMLFPVIFLIFVPMMVIMVGPALVNMLGDLGL